MTMLIRTNINLEQKQWANAKHFCDEHHISISELIRQALNRYLAENKMSQAMFGFLKGKLPDGLEYQRKMREHED